MGVFFVLVLMCVDIARVLLMLNLLLGELENGESKKKRGRGWEVEG